MLTVLITSTFVRPVSSESTVLVGQMASWQKIFGTGYAINKPQLSKVNQRQLSIQRLNSSHQNSTNETSGLVPLLLEVSSCKNRATHTNGRL
jgi:hypothetical protein